MKILLLVLCLFSFSVNAEDVKIYTENDTPPDVKSNMLLVYDLSSSMEKEEPDVLNPYDPDTDYPGSKYTDNSKLYTVSGLFDGNPGALIPVAVKASWFHCESMKVPLATQGWAVDKFTNRLAGIAIWGALMPITSAIIECRSDAGVHGENGTSNKKWASKKWAWAWNWKKDAWTDNESDSITWNDLFSAPYAVYTANYMRWYHFHREISPDAALTRLEILQRETKKIADSTGSVNIGMVATNRWSAGGYVNAAVKDIDAGTNREDFNTVVDNLVVREPVKIAGVTIVGSGTPLAETLWEAYRYYGDKGVDRGHGQFGQDVSVADSRKPASTNTYKSPIVHQCQANTQVVFSDGSPSFDNARNIAIRGVAATANVPLPHELSKGCGVLRFQSCLPHLAWYMNNGDVHDGLPGKQKVKTYTIGGFQSTGAVELQKTAKYGGGRYYSANSGDELQTALRSILIDVLAVDSSFAAPAVSVNAFNELKHNDELYYALFKPAGTKRWSGNLKKYKLGKNGGQDIIQDKNNMQAVDPVSGFFKKGATSFWSAAPDGHKVELGGAAGLLVSPRSLLTYTDEYNTLTTPGSLVSIDSSISKTLLGNAGMSDDYRAQLIEHTQGINQSELNFADSLHSEPVVLTHGGTEANPQGTVFFGTNKGFIHGVDTQTGVTRFSFAPKELLPNLEIYFKNQSSTEKTYGMDGPITAWIETTDGKITHGLPKSGDKVSLLAGMRRGGRNYYMLDLSEYVHNTSTAPKLKWVIEGGVGAYSRMGQTWSAPRQIKMKINGSFKNILAIGGGYDPAQDSAAIPTADSMGNAIYLVDADSGKLLWQASPDTGAQLALSKMQNGFVSALTPIDVDGDGHVETIFAADVGGHLWRFDFNKDNKGTGTPDEFATGGMIAEVSGSGVGEEAQAANNRRFFAGVSAALAMDSQGKRYYTLAIGSGFRPELLAENIQDRFYVFKDVHVGVAPGSYSKIVETELYDASANLIQSGTDAEKALAIKNISSAKGWYINLRTSEKVFDAPTTFDGNFLFTSFRKSGNSISCGSDTGAGAFYILSQATGVGRIGTKAAPERSKDLKRAGIPSKIVTIFTEDSVVTLAGAEIIPEASTPRPYQKTFWYEYQ